MPDRQSARPSGRTISDREARAIAYALCDEIETRALALIAKEPGLDMPAATMRVILALGAR
jgi:hypothetical protein